MLSAHEVVALCAAEVVATGAGALDEDAPPPVPALQPSSVSAAATGPIAPQRPRPHLLLVTALCLHGGGVGLVGNVGPVRLQEFWSRMDEQFGSARAQTVVRDHSFHELGGRTALEAIEAGVPVRTVWRQVCAAYDVPPKER